MIDFQEALTAVLAHKSEFPVVEIPLLESSGRVLATDIPADRDFPPFDRATKDGIAISYAAYARGDRVFPIREVAPAGSARRQLRTPGGCIEIMTGAVVPEGCDTVIMYEHLNIENGKARISEDVKQGQNIHRKGSDLLQGSVILKKNTVINSGAIGALASVGRAMVPVKAMPEAVVVSTGNELVDVDRQPLPHQIRRSNSLGLKVLLEQLGVKTSLLHIADDRAALESGLKAALDQNRVLVISGGVSMGKYDMVPDALEACGVKQVFHRVKQRPGKPFWFGVVPETGTPVFSFPGNPVSTFVNFHVYFLPWLSAGLGLAPPIRELILQGSLDNKTPLTLFKGMKITGGMGVLKGTPVLQNGSGDLLSLVNYDGIIQLDPEKEYLKGDSVPYISCNLNVL